MKNIWTFLIVALLCSCTHTVPDSGEKLVYPLKKADRAVLQQRIATLKEGMTVKQVLRTVGVAGCPKAEWPITGNNSTITQIGSGYLLHLDFANGTEGGGLVSAHITEEPSNPLTGD